MEELILKYEKRLPAHWNYQRIEIPDLKNRKNLSELQQKEKEADLIQSKIKREFAIKDSSQLIPGHGGVYDRIDSLIFLSPFFVIVVKYLRH